MPNNGTLRIASNEQDFQLRTQLHGSVGELAAVNAAGKADIGYQHVNLALALQLREPGGAVMRLGRAAAEIFQHLHDEHADGWLVIDDQHGFAVLCAVDLSQFRLVFGEYLAGMMARQI